MNRFKTNFAQRITCSPLSRCTDPVVIVHNDTSLLQLLAKPDKDCKMNRISQSRTASANGLSVLTRVEPQLWMLLTHSNLKSERYHRCLDFLCGRCAHFGESRMKLREKVRLITDC